MRVKMLPVIGDQNCRTSVFKIIQKKVYSLLRDGLIFHIKAKLQTEDFQNPRKIGILEEFQTEQLEDML